MISLRPDIYFGMYYDANIYRLTDVFRECKVIDAKTIYPLSLFSKAQLMKPPSNVMLLN